MIRYSLQCPKDHQYDSWFQNSDAYEKLKSSGYLSCEVCGCDGVQKAIMAPNISTSKKRVDHASDDISSFLQFENVGDRFADEVRAIHYGTAEDRDICGQATIGQVNELVEEGITDFGVIAERTTN